MRGRLARTHRVELRLLEVGGDPDVVRDKHGEGGSWRGVLADRRREIDDAAGLGRLHGRIREVELGLVALGVGLRQVGFVAAALRLERVDLALSRGQRRLSAS